LPNTLSVLEHFDNAVSSASHPSETARLFLQLTFALAQLTASSNWLEQPAASAASAALSPLASQVVRSLPVQPSQVQMSLQSDDVETPPPQPAADAAIPESARVMSAAMKLKLLFFMGGDLF
jgi:hypothetical protein